MELATGVPPAFGGPASGMRAAGAAGLPEVLGALLVSGAAGERGAASGKRGAGAAGTPGPLEVLGATSVRAAGEDAAGAEPLPGGLGAVSGKRGADVAGKEEPLEVLGT